ncbi:MAG: alpha/beta hydrolase [Candidatus Magasanikbacteria bacterium]
MQKQLKSFDGTQINYDIVRVKNSEKFLIFLHGVGSDLTSWHKETVPFHKKGYSTLVLDMRGHGKSDRPETPQDYDLNNFAKDVFLIIKHENIEKFVFVGHCFGAMVSMMFHKMYPKLAKSYILVDSTYKAPRSLRLIFHKNLFFVKLLNYFLIRSVDNKKIFGHNNFDKYVGTGDWNIQRIFADITHTSFKSWIFTYQNVAKFDAIDIMKKIKQRVLIVEGGRDSVISVLQAKKMHSLIQNSELSIVPEANHIIILNNPKELEVEIYKFLKSLNF